MNPATKRSLLFTLNSFLACALALYVAFLFDLRNPFWAMLTVYITSQPIAGAVLSKAFFRIVGTLIGVTAALLIVPNLSNAPELMLLAMAIWLGVALYLSLINRGPHSYAFMLAGYTVALVGLPQILNPNDIFDTAVSRAEEIVIGVISATLTHGLIFPMSAERAVLGKLAGSLRDARGWIRTAMTAQATAAEQKARRRLAADLAELTALAGHLPFEPLARHSALRIMNALEHRMLGLLPLLSAVEDRLTALRQCGPVPENIEQLMIEVETWIEREQASEGAAPLLAACRAAEPMVGPASSWRELVTLSLLERLAELIIAWRDTQELARLLRDPNAPCCAEVRALIEGASRRPLHVDHGMAALSGTAAGLGLLASGAFAIVMDWNEGFIAVGITAVLCSLFAAVDDPTPFQKMWFMWSLISIPIAAIYEFAVLPAVDGYGLLMLALAPVLLAGGWYMSVPQHALRGLTVMINFSAGLALQSSLKSDFESFATANTAVLIGSLIALGVTALVRTVRAEFVARRILRTAWGDLAALAAGLQTSTREGWVSRMLDRLSQLLPRLAQAGSAEDLQVSDALNDLRLGVNLVELRQAAAASHGAPVAELRRFLGSFAAHFNAQKRRGAQVPAADLLAQLDAVIAYVLQAENPEQRMRAAVAAAGLRRNLFPAAEPYRSTGEAA